MSNTKGVTPYARWSETFPAAVYEALGFYLIGRGEGSPDAFEHVLHGCHGPVDREWARERIGAGVDPDTAAQGRVLELSPAGPEAGRYPPVAPLPGATTPLHIAAREGHEETARFLLDHGADPRAVDPGGRTPLDLAVAGELRRLLQDHTTAR